MENYPDPVIIDKETCIYARFDGMNNPAAFNVPIFFSNSDILRDKHIKGIEVKSLPASDIASSTILTDIGFIGDVVSQTDLNFFTITLVGKNDEEILNDYPLLLLNTIYTEGKLRSFNCVIDLSKSYIRNFGLAGLTAKNVIPIQFYYSNLFK
jgi:hypothetical protein